MRQEREIAQGQLRDFEVRIGQPFPHADYLGQLASLRDQLKAGLSGAEPQEGAPSVADIAAQIKALKAAHTIEATPERAGKRRTVAAEEPVTARIRRRTEAMPASDSTMESDAAASKAGTPTPPVAPSPHAGTMQDWSAELERTSRERTAMGR